MNERFMSLYRESIHYKAERERNPEASDIVLLGYCHASDDFYSREAMMLTPYLNKWKAKMRH